MFLNHDPQSSMLMATKQFLFPPLKQTLTDPAFTGLTPSFYGGQKVNALFAEISKTVTTNFQWSPFNDYVTSSNNQIFGGALIAKKPALRGAGHLAGQPDALCEAAGLRRQQVGHHGHRDQAGAGQVQARRNRRISSWHRS